MQQPSARKRPSNPLIWQHIISEIHHSFGFFLRSTDSSELEGLLTGAFLWKLGTHQSLQVRIQREAGCAVGIVHHYNKVKDGTVTQRTRGTSAINGFAEWILGVEMTNKEQKLRRVSFEKVKAGEEGRAIDFQIDSSQLGVVRMKALEQCND